MTENNLKKIIKFQAQWCKPCKIFHETVIQVLKEFPEYELESVDIDDYPEEARKYGIKSLPTIIINNEKFSMCSANELRKLLIG